MWVVDTVVMKDIRMRVDNGGEQWSQSQNRAEGSVETGWRIMVIYVI